MFEESIPKFNDRQQYSVQIFSLCEDMGPHCTATINVHFFAEKVQSSIFDA